MGGLASEITGGGRFGGGDGFGRGGCAGAGVTYLLFVLFEMPSEYPQTPDSLHPAIRCFQFRPDSQKVSCCLSIHEAVVDPVRS